MAKHKSKWQMLKDYLVFYRKAGNLHNLHSPFVYHLAKDCLYDKTNYPDYQKLKSYQKTLLKDNSVLKIEDLGAGSHVFNSSLRSVKTIAKVSGSSLKDMKRFYRLVKYFKPHQILELGTSLGKATYAMSLASSTSNIITIEGDQSLVRFTDALLKQFGKENIQVIHQDFNSFLKQLNSTNQIFDMVFMDGNHQLKPTIDYFEKLQKHLHNDSVVIVDDIYWSDDMKQAWQVLKNHPNVKQSIDLFHFGLLFFREEQLSQDFTIRFSTFNLF